jgi:hypothetical protein
VGGGHQPRLLSPVTTGGEGGVGHSRTSRDPAGRVAGHLGVLTCAAWPTDEGRTERGFLTRAGLEKTQLSGHSGELEEWSVNRLFQAATLEWPPSRRFDHRRASCPEAARRVAATRSPHGGQAGSGRRAESQQDRLEDAGVVEERLGYGAGLRPRGHHQSGYPHPNRPKLTGSSSGASGGGTWSKNPPCSS